MALVALASARGAPGVTTTAVALVLLWPGPALLAECDASGGSSVLAGYLRGGVPHDRGLVGLAVALRQGALAEALWAQTGVLAEDRRVLPGPVDAGQATSLPPLWAPLAGLLRSVDSAGTAVVVDAGRLGAEAGPLPVLRAADDVLLVVRSGLDAAAAARARLGLLREQLSAAGTARLSLLVVGEGRPYSAAELADVLEVPVAAALPWDPAAAEAFSVGTGGRRLSGSPLVRAVGALAASLQGSGSPLASAPPADRPPVAAALLQGMPTAVAREALAAGG